MFGFGSARKIRHLERRLAKLETQNAQLIHAIQHPPSPAGETVSGLMGTLANNQVQQIEATGGFIKLIHEIAVERMGVAMGKRNYARRGGAARAARAIRDERGRMRGSRERSGCILCDNPMTANFSMEQWKDHQLHKGFEYGSERTARTSEYGRDATDTVYSTVPESHVHDDGTVHDGPPHPEPTYPLPVVTVPDGNPDSRTSSNTSSEQAAPNGRVVQ